MMEKSSKTSKIAAWILVTINVITTIISLIAISFGLWCIAAPYSLSSAIDTLGRPSFKMLLPPEVLSVQLGMGIVTLSCFVFFMSYMGLHGAITRSPFTLFMYTALVVLLLLLEYALFYYFVSSFIEKGLRKDDEFLVHAIRLIFKCCDYNTTVRSNAKLPWSCCEVAGHFNCTASDVFNKDCNQTILNWLDSYQTAIYISLAVFHILLVSCSLIRRSHVSSGSDS